MTILNFSEYNTNESKKCVIKVGDTIVVSKDDTSDEPKRSLKVGDEYVVKHIDYMSGWLKLEGEKWLHNPENFKKVKKDKKINEDSATTGVGAGTGTAASGGAVGSFTSAAGMNIGGGSSGSAFNTNSSSNGMGAIKSSQPSPIPGDVAGSTKGSGDIGSVLGTFTKQPAGGADKKRKKKGEKVENQIKNMYVVKFSEFDGVKNVKENAYIPPVKVKCQECGEEVEDDFVTMLGHVQNKHWAQQNSPYVDFEPREMVKQFFHKAPEKK